MDNMHITNDADKAAIERELNAVVDQSLAKRASDASSPYWHYCQASKTGNKLKRIAERLQHRTTDSTTSIPVTRPNQRRRSSALRMRNAASSGARAITLDTTKLAQRPPVATRRTTEPVDTVEPEPTLDTIAQRLRVVEASIAALPTYVTALQTTMQQLHADLARLRTSSKPDATELPPLHVSPLSPAMR
ncbi:hypothetical protein SPRG_12948 [Saprolegnia parasitica CBS 223.65]|uniref:Uncharacterized protein n=1 Tax=Saprolegnia parasitica (strain CBS 223.65) TaxID=695850 RepID=A0A067C322_SAPPC|nr:hypothetical protein SPRG_12948 [Saprolegnia parasitica CBS 223.65]KDO21167.1 hypothetical protein SPRG_12948 [Saprolegnia parasitica CBS 223.65]|eukprot:XP_012208164.1 hypothetical protein SPRG_12948 [Saprolegnia parasitica CBS 223.65]